MFTPRKYSALLTVLGLAVATPMALGATPSRGPQDQAGKLAQYYESLSARTLSRYYEEATYLVKAKIEIEQPPDFDLSGEDPSVNSGDAPPQLPGLPFLPETMQPSPSTADKENKQAEGTTNQTVSLDVLVDTSYSDKDVDFVRNLLTMAIHLDELRGDRVTVHEGVFPRDNRALQSYRKNIEAPPGIGSTQENKKDSNGNDLGNNRDSGSRAEKAGANPFSAYMDHLPSLIPLLLICLLILACVWMVSRAIVGAGSSHKRDQALPIIPLAEPTKAVEANKGMLTKVQPSELGSFRPFLLNCFVGSPKHCGQIIKSWIKREPDKGLRDSAAMVASLDARLMSVLAPELGRDLMQQLEVHLNSGEAPPPEELLTVYKEFKREFQNLSNGESSDDQYKDLFGFLHQMNEQQIMHILRDESQGIAGLVMAQLPGEMASGILQKVDPDSRAKLLIAMGNIDHIPLNVYKEIADRLSLKALEVGNMRFVAADGVDSILELIDKLPLALQFQYIHSVSEMDLGLGEKIRNRYVTLPEVAGLPDKFLSGILQNMDQETLTLALLHVEEAIRTKVLSLLPERMQMMVSGGMEGLRDVTPKASEIAQRRLLLKIRDEIKHSGRPA
jgi:flagellar motor switch protein FliG